MNKKTVCLAPVALLLTCATHADLVVQLDGYGYGGYQNVAVNAQYEWDAHTGTEQYYNLRTFEHYWSSESSDEVYLTHCIQIYRGVDLGGIYDFDVVDIQDAPNSPPWPGEMGDVRATLLRDLYSRWVDPSRGGIYGGTGADARASAFQLVAWEITHENFTAKTAADMLTQISFDFGAIQWQSDGGMVKDYVFDMVSTLGEGGWLYSDLDGWTSNDSQDQSRYVPAPAVLSMFGMGFSGLIRRRRR